MNDVHIYDAIVLGGGPAGYSAALYASHASLDTLVLEQGMPGGQIATSDTIENYPGIPSISGAELGQRMQDHASEAGAATEYGMVTGLNRLESDLFEVTTDMASYLGRSVIAATGATPRTAGFEGEDAFRGRGVSYCATCDGMFYRGKHVFVIGGGNSACEEAIYLSNIADRVEVVLRRDEFRAPRGMVERMHQHDNITVRYQTSIVAVRGERLLSEVSFRNNATNAVTVETYDEGSMGIFVATGHIPATDLVEPYVDLGPDGSVSVDAAMATKTPGLYCAGDIRTGAMRQVIAAAADGAMAGVSAYHYVENRWRS